MIRKRLTYSNVMSSIAVFLVLGGGAAIAANQLAKNSVGKKQLKANAVTATKIKKNAVSNKKLSADAVTTPKIANGAVDNTKIADNAITSNKIADGNVTNADLSAATNESFARVVARLRGGAQLPFTAPQIYPLNNPNWTQRAGENNQIIGGLTVNFTAGCEPPRTAIAYMLLDAVNPAAPEPQDIIGFNQMIDKSIGSVTRTMSFGPFPGGFGSSLLFGPTADTNHTVSFLLLGSSCNSGAGVNAIGGGVDVVGSK